MKRVIDLDIYFNLPSVSGKGFTDGQGSYCSYGKLGPATNDTWTTKYNTKRDIKVVPNGVVELFKHYMDEYNKGADGLLAVAVLANERGEFDKADKHALSVALASGLYELKSSPEHKAFVQAVKRKAKVLTKV